MNVVRRRRPDVEVGALARCATHRRHALMSTPKRAWPNQSSRLAHAPENAAPRLHVDAGTPAWRLLIRAAYVVIRPAGRLTRLLVRLRVPTFEDRIVELALVGRRTGRPRPVLLTLIRLDGHWYVGHPNGPRAWLANLRAADTVELRLPRGRDATVRPSGLPLGPERDAVIQATAEQQPFGVRTVYRAAQRHILRAGIYYRLDQIHPAEGDPGACTRLRGTTTNSC